MPDSFKSKAKVSTTCKSVLATVYVKESEISKIMNNKLGTQLFVLVITNFKNCLEISVVHSHIQIEQIKSPDVS